MPERMFKDPDNEFVEYLIDQYGIDFMRARRFSRDISFDTFASRLGEIEQIIDPITASRAMRYGQLLEAIKNGEFQEYVTLARRVAQQLGAEVPDNAESFYSTSNLRQFIEPQQPTIDVACIDGKYRIFDVKDDKSSAYLTVLLREGSLRLDRNERWNGNGGPRSGSILKIIAHQITHAFLDLGLENPDIRVNHEQRTLTISASDKKKLEEITKEVYKKHPEPDYSL